MARHVNPSIRQRSSRNPSTRGMSGSRIGCSRARAVLVTVATLGCAVAGSIGHGQSSRGPGRCQRRAENFQHRMLGVSFQCPRWFGLWPLARRRRRAQGGFASRVRLQQCAQKFRSGLEQRHIEPVSHRPQPIGPGHDHAGDCSFYGGPHRPHRLSRDAERRPRRRRSGRASVPPVVGPSQAQLDDAASDTQDWLYATHDYAGTRFVDLKQITPANAATLRPVCLYRADEEAPTQTDPLVYKGVMYLTFGPTTVAIDATTCRQIWAYTWPLQGHIISPTNRGVAIKDGKLVRGVADGHLIALDLASGSLLWSQQIASATNGQYLSMPPLIWGDMVIYGPAGADYGAQNWIGAFKLETGDPLWRFYLVPNPGQPGAASWKDQAALKHGGGSLWTPLSLDAKAGILYVPVGNPAPDFYGAVRPGADLYTDSVLALDVRTGKLLWYHQFVVHDEHDTDLSQVSPLFEVKVGDADRQLMAVSGKDGLLRVVDRKTHDVLYEVPITTRENADAEPTVDGAHRCPGLLGGEEWNGPAFDPVSKQLFVNSVDWCGTFKKFPAPPAYTSEQHYYGGSVTPDPRDQAKGWLTAFDAATGKVNWKYQAPTPLIAGIVATSGGVLFTGDLDGNFLVMNSATGAPLYRFNTGGSVGGGAVSYAAERQAICRHHLGRRVGLLRRQRPAGGGGLRSAVTRAHAEAPAAMATLLQPYKSQEARGK